MATSRTGTTKWRTARAAALRRAYAAGVLACPLCGVTLDYARTLTPPSAEVDHVTPHAAGGDDSPDNLRVICRRCNQRLGGHEGAARTPRRGRRPAAPAPPPAVRPTATSGTW